MFEKFINKVGIDKILHFCVGGVITFCVSNVAMLQEGFTGVGNLWFPIIGTIVAAFFAGIKECFIDNTPDVKDFIATLLGSVLVFVVNAIGILFYIWSN